MTFDGDNTEIISACAFYNDVNLKNIKITKKVNNISSEAFEACSGLINIEIDPNNIYYEYNNGMLQTKGENKKIVFLSSKYYEGKTELSIPDGTKEFDTYFSNLKITTLKVPQSIEKLPEDGSKYPKTLKNIIIDDKNENFKVSEKCIYTKKSPINLVYCFSDAAEITLTEKVETINSDYPFQGCLNATVINIPDTVTYFGAAITSTVGEKVKTLNIGSKVKNFSTWAFAGSIGVKVNVSNDNPYLRVENDILYSKDDKIIYSVLYKIKGEFTLKSGITRIYAFCFANQYEMTDLKLNKDVQTIENQVFVGCNKLTKLYLPESIKSLNGRTFESCNNLKEVHIPKKKDSIADAPWGLPIGERGIYWDA